MTGGVPFCRHGDLLSLAALVVGSVVKCMIFKKPDGSSRVSATASNESFLLVNVYYVLPCRELGE